MAIAAFTAGRRRRRGHRTPRGPGDLRQRPQGTRHRGARCGPATALPLEPPAPTRPSGALRWGPGPSSFPSLSSPGYSPAPPLGPSLTSPGARGPPRSQRPQASRSAISAPRPQRRRQLWRHKRLKTRSSAEAQLPPRQAERRREGAVCSRGRSWSERIRCVGRSPWAGEEAGTCDSRTAIPHVVVAGIPPGERSAPLGFGLERARPFMV